MDVVEIASWVIVLGVSIPIIIFGIMMLFVALFWSVESGFFTYGICMWGFLQSLSVGNTALAAVILFAGVAAGWLHQEMRST